MNKQLNGFDSVAFMYDWLARLVFGNEIVRAQKCYLNALKNAKEVLIIGGGTGWIAREVLNVSPSIHVTYIEASQQMLNLTVRKITSRESRVTLIHGIHEDIVSNKVYDAVITNFFLDLFKEEDLAGVISRIKSHLDKNSLWLISDFENCNKGWQKILLYVMYYFFRVTSRVSTKKLANWRAVMFREGLKEMKCERFYHGFIYSGLYQLNE
jgi:tRNA (cmo5U34)-methyltransferase